MAWVATVAEDTIPLGTCHETEVSGEPILLVRTGRGVFACAAYCPHKAMNLEAGEVEGAKLTCPLHAATFDLTTGTPDEDTDWAGVLPVYACEVRDGEVFVDLDQAPPERAMSFDDEE